jgi:hypothetical protein
MTNMNGALTGMEAAYNGQTQKLVVKKCAGDHCETSTKKVDLAKVLAAPASKMSLFKRLQADWLSGNVANKKGTKGKKGKGSRGSKRRTQKKSKSKSKSKNKNGKRKQTKRKK